MNAQQPPLFETTQTQHGTRYVPYRGDGATFDAERDSERLGRQMDTVYGVMKDGCWRTLPEIAELTGYSEAPISSRLRDFRKDRFRKRYGVAGMVSERITNGLWRYRLQLAPSPEGSTGSAFQAGAVRERGRLM